MSTLKSTAVRIGEPALGAVVLYCAKHGCTARTAVETLVCAGLVQVGISNPQPKRRMPSKRKTDPTPATKSPQPLTHQASNGKRTGPKGG